MYFILSFHVVLRSLQNLCRLLLRFLKRIFWHLVGLLLLGPAHCKALPTQDSSEQKIEDKRSCLERDLSPRSQYLSGQNPRPRPRYDCDRHCTIEQMSLENRKSTAASFSGGLSFKSRTEDHLPSTDVSWFSSVPPHKYRDSSLN
jgi:hypothetical protein